MKKAELELLVEDRDYTKIPIGPYCYNNKICPYWYRAEDGVDQAYGYCSYLHKGDWMKDGTMLLWDQVKECGVNDDNEDSDELETDRIISDQTVGHPIC